MTDSEHKELREHIEFLKKVVADAPHGAVCSFRLAQIGVPLSITVPCDCWKSREMITTPYSIPEKKKK